MKQNWPFNGTVYGRREQRGLRTVPAYRAHRCSFKRASQRALTTLHHGGGGGWKTQDTKTLDIRMQDQLHGREK